MYTHRGGANRKKGVLTRRVSSLPFQRAENTVHTHEEEEEKGEILFRSLLPSLRVFLRPWYNCFFFRGRKKEATKEEEEEAHTTTEQRRKANGWVSVAAAAAAAAAASSCSCCCSGRRRRECGRCCAQRVRSPSEQNVSSLTCSLSPPPLRLRLLQRSLNAPVHSLLRLQGLCLCGSLKNSTSYAQHLPLRLCIHARLGL